MKEGKTKSNIKPVLSLYTKGKKSDMISISPSIKNKVSPDDSLAPIFLPIAWLKVPVILKIFISGNCFARFMLSSVELEST